MTEHGNRHRTQQQKPRATMPLLTLNQAAKAAKKSKSTLLDAINSGRLSAFKTHRNQWQIDPDDLFRAYPSTEQEPNIKTDLDPRRPNNETAILQRQVYFLEHLINDIKDERDDLRRRLNEEEEERRKLTALITKIFDNHDQCTWLNANKEKAINEENKPSYIQTEAMAEVLDRWTLTYNEGKICGLLKRGKNLIIENYFFPNPSVLYLDSNTEIIKDLTRAGVLHFGQVSERFKQVTNSVLQDRDIKEIIDKDFLYITIRYLEWGTIELPGYKFHMPPVSG
jgi:hypothetical protein